MAEEVEAGGGNPINIENVQNLIIGGEHHHQHEPSAAAVQVLQQRGIGLVKNIQLGNLKSDVVTHDKQINEAEIPELHPILVETDIYEGQQSDQKEEFIPSTERKVKKNLDGKIVDFTTLLSLVMTTHFLSLVGPAGSGKTTLSKRIVRALLNMGRFVILIKFMSLDYPSGFTLTLQDLILGQFNELDKEIRGNAFEWMKQNPGECVLVFDGFDQFRWTLKDQKPRQAFYDTPLSVQQLFANLCSGEFFDKSHLVFTSRQHSMLSLPSDLRPNLTIHVHDLSTDDMKKLFFLFARDSANKLWEIMTTKSPQLFDLCHNPMLLQFIVCAGLYKEANQHKTITNIFNVVFEQIQHSIFKEDHEIDKFKQLIGRLAYNGMERKKIVFEAADLTKEGLKVVDVQVFVIKTPKHLGFPVPKLFEGDMKFYFMHQLLQEFFAAIYIAMYMPVSTFNQTIESVVNEGHWSMVRRFLCGLLLGNSDVKGKSWVLYDQLVKVLESCDSSERKKRQQISEFLVDLQECSGDVKNSLASKFPVELDFSMTPMSLGACHALGDILPRIPHPDVKLHLDKCNLNLESVKWISKGISKMQHEFEELYLSFNLFGDDGLKIISKYLNKVKRLHMGFCGITKHGIKVLVEELKKLEHPLEELDLGSNKFGDDGLKLISKYLNKVKRLNMGVCGITKHGIEVFVEGLKQLEHPLERLDLGSNKFGDDGLKLISKYLNKVKRLRMWKCGITKHGIEVLAEGLKQLEHPLEKLDLGLNELGDDGLKLISKYLNKVKCLHMGYCGITKHGIEVLVEGLKKLEHPMEYLDISSNEFRDDGLKLICECLNKTRSLDVRRCRISETGKKLLMEEISKRKLDIENFNFEFQ